MLSLPGGFEWLIILFIVLIIFGGKKLPELMGGLGKGIKSFKKGLKSDEADDVLTNNGSKKSNNQENQKSDFIE